MNNKQNKTMISWEEIKSLYPINKMKYGPHNIDVYSLIFGSLLGDYYAEKRNGSTRIILQQEKSNFNYFMWFHEYLATRGYCSPNKPKLETRIGKNKKVRLLRTGNS